MITKEDLKEYGKVDFCGEVNNKFRIRITEGFDCNAIKTFELMGKINDMIGHKYPLLDKCVSEKNLFDYILKQRV